MTVLSTALGVAAPLLLPRQLTHWAGALLFCGFGVQMLHKSARSPPAGEGGSEELEEVEGELKQSSADKRYGQYSRYLSPVLAQAFVMTFLAEWGDRSQARSWHSPLSAPSAPSHAAVQIATITMGADYNALGICVGGSAGHATATALAVVGGRYLASSISERAMGFAGGATFLLFGILACLEGACGCWLHRLWARLTLSFSRQTRRRTSPPRRCPPGWPATLRWRADGRRSGRDRL